MKKFNLVKITDTNGTITGVKGKISYQALTDDEENNLLTMESGYSYISKDFKVENLGEVSVPSWKNIIENYEFVQEEEIHAEKEGAEQDAGDFQQGNKYMFEFAHKNILKGTIAGILNKQKTFTIHDNGNVFFEDFKNNDLRIISSEMNHEDGLFTLELDKEYRDIDIVVSYEYPYENN